MKSSNAPLVDVSELRCAIKKEYSEVALHHDKGFHFHTGRKLAGILGYAQEWIDRLPDDAVESLAGTGNPFRAGAIRLGEKIVDAGCGSGTDSLLAAMFTGADGAVIGVDMTSEMLSKAQKAAVQLNLKNVEFRNGYLEELPVENAWADVVISNGSLNLCPDKLRVLLEFHRILAPHGRLQIGDIIVHKAVPQTAKQNIDLWTG
jgi:arsenite methyltransferase